jgi:diguanylate cyclase (GGDEF)-like protein
MIMDDIRYCEFMFLQAVASRKIDLFNICDGGAQAKSVGINHGMYPEMAEALLEDLYIQFTDSSIQLFVSRLRGELYGDQKPPGNFYDYEWNNPRSTLHSILTKNSLRQIAITYRGLRRIEELRDLLKADRILEDFGVLLSIRYFRRDLQDAIQRDASVPVAVLYADMDDSEIVNKQHGQDAGDVVMKSYLEAVRDGLGSLGTGYRGVGDETCALIVGQDHQRVLEIAEKIRKTVETMQRAYKGTPLPKVTTSIGVATTPSLPRVMDVETVAQDRQRQAKREGKNRVVCA